jgi:serine-type D-Ala-D-Ala carboxypeptidase/endopeptidase
VVTARPRTGLAEIDAEPGFEIGSLTKVLTATLLADLHLCGEIRLGDPLTRHLDAAQLPRWAGRVPTLEELATHRAALPNTPPPLARRELLAVAGLLRGDPWRGVGDDEYRRMLRAMRPRRPPGGRVRYSSIGFGLLGDALARHAGMSYEALLRDRICRPLGMADTAIDPAAVRGRLLQGRSPRGAPRPPLRDCMPAAGSVRSTAPDLLRFLRTCLRPAPDAPLGEAAALAQPPRAKINRHLSVGLGWLILHRGKDRTIVWHNGGTWGFRSFAALVPGRQLAVVVLSNTARSIDRLGFTIVERLAADAA